MAEKHTHLWNDLPIAERERLAPYQMESQILHLQQARSLIVKNHTRTLEEIDAWIANIRRSLKEVDNG